MEMLFLRDFRSFAGGHLKVRDYIRHSSASRLVQPVLYMTAESAGIPPADDIFADIGCERLPSPRPSAAYFVAGEDWRILDTAGISCAGRPVINLIQGVRHADPGTYLFACLRRPAIRLCVSQAVADAIRPFAEGPIYTMPTGVELPDLDPGAFPRADIFIGGLKAADLANRVRVCLGAEAGVFLLREHVPRPTFLAAVAGAEIAILLPLEREGFFLPPLEAMMLGRPIVMTDCIGARDYCFDRVNCLVAPREPDAIADSARALLASPQLRERIIAGGRATAAARSIAAERRAYVDVLRAHGIGV